MEEHAEELTYPDLFGGHPRSNPIKPSFGQTTKVESRHEDRRFGRHIENLSFKDRKTILKRMSDQARNAMRKVMKANRKRYSARDIKLNSESIERHNEGYKFMKTIGGSPAYFEKVKKHLFTMLRYHGRATFFLTFSAAEHHWVDLLRNLQKVVENDDREFSDEEILEWSFDRKQKLLLSDPITCARHFEHRTKILFTDFLKAKDGPLGTLKEFFYRVEFQKRGSPHLHCLVWIEGAPQFNKGNESEVCKWVDGFISCSKSLNVDFLSEEDKHNLIAKQTHRHTRTCPRLNKVCRFGFPNPPVDCTIILSPLNRFHQTVWMLTEKKEPFIDRITRRLRIS
jgi:hypothetical protein